MNSETDTQNEIEITELKSIREKKKISVKALSDSLKISRDFVNYIESGMFEKLGAPTFVKGHVTNYCRALEIDPKIIISQIPDNVLQVQTLLPSDAMGASPLAKVRRKSNHFGKYAVGTALLSMLALSFYFVWDKWSVPQQANEVKLLANSETNGGQKPSNVAKPITYSSIIPQVSLESNKAEDNTQSQEEDTAIESENQIDEAPDLDDQLDQLSASVDTAVADPMATIATKYDIQLDLKEQSWVSIKTENGNKVEHNLVEPGVYNYQADLPLHFRIGNAKNTQVFINDVEVDLTEYMRKDIADFKWPLDPS